MPFPIKRNASIRAAFNAILSAQLLALSIPWWISASVELFSKSTVLHLITALAIVGSPNTATMGLYLLIQIKLNAFQRKKSPVARRVEQIAAFLALSFLLIVDHSNSASMVNGKTRLATMDWSILTRLSRNVSRPMFSSAAHVALLNAPLLPLLQLLLLLLLRQLPQLLFLRLMSSSLLKRNPKKTCSAITFT